MNIFDRIVEARRDVGQAITQVAIAKDLGVAQAAVGKWKAGHGIKLAHAMAVAYQTGTCVEWLLTGRGPKYPISNDTRTAEMCSLFEQLSEEDREEVLEFAKFRASRHPLP